MHSAAPCSCLGSWHLCPALDSVCSTMSHPLRLGGITAHSRREGSTSPTTSLVITIAEWQTMPCCDSLLPKRGDHSVRREAGASAFLHHTGDACSLCSGGSDCSDRQCRSGSGSPWFSTCPAQRLARLASALPPPSLRRILRGGNSTGVRGQTMVLCQPLHHLTGGGPLSGLDLFERIWALPEGRDLPRLMQAFRERFGIRFGCCLELLQTPAATPVGPCYGTPAPTDVQGNRSKGAAAPNARAHPSGHRP